MKAGIYFGKEQIEIREQPLPHITPMCSGIAAKIKETPKALKQQGLEASERIYQQ